MNGIDRPSVLFISEPIIDYSLVVPQAFINSLPELQPGGNPRVTSERIEEIIKQAGHDPVIGIGGGALGFAKILSKLDFTCQVFGIVGRKGSPFADMYLKALTSLKIGVDKIKHSVSEEHGQCLCLIPENGAERYMLTALGAAQEFSADHLTPELFKGHTHVHLEGYGSNYSGFLERAVKLAKKTNMTVSLDVGQPFIVRDENRRSTILNLLKTGNIDIFFGNEEEMKVLTQLEDPIEICNYLGQFVNNPIMTLAHEGCCVKGSNNEPANLYPILEQVEAVDPTGAGDSFGGGFLAAKLSHRSTDVCVRLATNIATTMVRQFGSSIPDAAWENGLYDRSMTMLASTNG